MRAEREFLRVIMSHRRCSILARTSTKKFKVCQALPDQDLEALAQFVSIMRFMFGFIRRASCVRTGRMPGE